MKCDRCDCPYCTMEDKFKLDLIWQWLEENDCQYAREIRKPPQDEHEGCQLMLWVGFRFSQAWIAIDSMPGDMVGVTTSADLVYNPNEGINIQQRHWTMADPKFFGDLDRLLDKFHERHADVRMHLWSLAP